jgi:hypothetical protein
MATKKIDNRRKDNLTPEQRAKVTQSVRDFHANPDKATSAGVVKEPRAINDVRRKFTDLSAPAVNIISKAVKGELAAQKSVWKGTDAERQKILDTDPSASFEDMTLDNGKVVEVLVEYTPVSAKQVGISQWVLTQEIALRKAAEDSKLRKLDIAMKNKKALDDGAISKLNQQQIAKDFGGPVSLNNFSMELDDEDDDFDE